MHERDRRTDAQAAARRGARFGGERLGGFDLGEDDLDALVKGGADVGQVLATRRAVEQRTPSCCSSVCTCLPTSCDDMPSASPAAENEPSSTARAKNDHSPKNDPLQTIRFK